MTSLAGTLAPHYSRFRVGERLLLTGHSHQAWPDVAELGLLDAFADATAEVDGKWGRAFARAESLRACCRRWLADPHGEIALGASTFDLVTRLLSALDLRGRPRVVTSDGEFHTLRRLLGRLAEEGVEVVRVPALPADTLAARAAAATDGRTAAVLLSAVLYETAHLVPNLGETAAACRRHGAEFVLDAYHAMGVLPLPVHAMGLASAWVVGGGYKYLQLGEGNCMLRVPPHADDLRPVLTGWYAEFTELSDGGRAGATRYGRGAARWAGATYDPTSHYRAHRVLGFFADHALTPSTLRAESQRQVGLLRAAFDDLDVDPRVVTRDRDHELTACGGFVALTAPSEPVAAELRRGLAERGVSTDHRGRRLRLGPAPYLTDDQLRSAIAALGETVAAVTRTAATLGRSVAEVAEAAAGASRAARRS